MNELNSEKIDRYLKSAKEYEEKGNYAQAGIYYRKTGEQEYKNFSLRMARKFEGEGELESVVIQYGIAGDKLKFKELSQKLALKFEQENDFGKALNYYYDIKNEEKIQEMFLKIAQIFEEAAQKDNNRIYWESAANCYKRAGNKLKFKELDDKIAKM